jgi:hypothetical protein
MIQFCCSGCNSPLSVSEDRGGSMISCPHCGQRTCVPTFLPIESRSDPELTAMPPLVTASKFQPRGARFSKKWFLSILTFPVYHFGSPAALLLALLLFPLPWVQVQCDKPIGNSGTKILVEQSGLQMISGGYSENAFLRDAGYERERKAVQERLAREKNAGSAWMIVYPLLLVMGILAGLLVWSFPRRSLMLIGCSASACLVLFVQARLGFPVERALPHALAKRVNLGESIGIEITSPTLLETRYTGWFWLTIVAVLAALVAACAEAWRMRMKSAKRVGAIR